MPQTRRFRKILVANRGEIARRVLRSCREMGIASVAVYSEADRSAPFVAEADEAVPLGGRTPAESYLRVDALLEAARRTRAEAIHPGYGFLAENADFARRCGEAGLVFIGPPPEAIAAMGSKLEAKRRMRAAGVPLLPSREIEGVEEAELGKAAQELGLPLLVKASAGGGGKGMRIVRSAEELPEAVAAARREAEAAFGDGSVFLERYLEGARHVEIQIFGDAHGRLLQLYERECSIQRRHQKILEEAPSPAVDAELRAAMGNAAVAAGRAIDYVGAGTVEFMLLPSREFFFLEVNTRLQVEHPVTELVTGLDLVRMQIEVAGGGALPEARELPTLRGHAIEARLYAEDPLRDFLPEVGTLHRFDFPERPGLRLDSGVESGSEVGVHYDPLLAKVIAWAPDRAEAAERLAAALAGARIHGLATNRDLLVRLLRHPEFLEGRIDTEFLERHPPASLGAPLADAEAEGLHALAACLAARAGAARRSRALPAVPRGWRNVPYQDAREEFEGASGVRELVYGFGREGLRARVDGAALSEPRLHAAREAEVDLEVAGVRRRYAVDRVGEHFYVDSPLGASALRRLPRFPEVETAREQGSLVAPMPGRILEIRVRQGDSVREGDILMVLEAMKMEQPVRAPRAGRVSELSAQEGEQVEAGRVLAVIDGDDDDFA